MVSITIHHIVSYNNAYAFVSIAHKTVDLPRCGPDVYTIQEELWHLMCASLPEPNKDLVYAQLYFQSNEEALQFRLGCMPAENNEGVQAAR